MGTAVIDWFSRRQKFAVRNSTAAEAMANADGCDHGIYQRELAKDFLVDVKPTPFLSDSESSVKLHNDYYACKKSKHILRAIATLRRCILERIYFMHHFPGISNWSDFLTKPLGPAQFAKFSDAILNAKCILPSWLDAGGGVRSSRVGSSRSSA